MRLASVFSSWLDGSSQKVSVLMFLFFQPVKTDDLLQEPTENTQSLIMKLESIFKPL